MNRCLRLLPILPLFAVIVLFLQFGETRMMHDNCKSDKLRELILETIGMYPHQYSYQAKYLKQQAEERFGNWWSTVIVSDRGGYGMSAVYDHHRNTSCEMMLFDTYYWVGRTC
ncbi:unnamed protein product, partial [Mesorhabditis belari]|uniref:Uncharacterized protein n=1 Tax=Mesorhabditis belari TaxID=2138241 RepID=A0AAF3JA69_9BILA